MRFKVTPMTWKVIILRYYMRYYEISPNFDMLLILLECVRTLWFLFISLFCDKTFFFFCLVGFSCLECTPSSKCSNNNNHPDQQRALCDYELYSRYLSKPEQAVIREWCWLSGLSWVVEPVVGLLSKVFNSTGSTYLHQPHTEVGRRAGCHWLSAVHRLFVSYIFAETDLAAQWHFDPYHNSHGHLYLGTWRPWDRQQIQESCYSFIIEMTVFWGIINHSTLKQDYYILYYNHVYERKRS